MAEVLLRLDNITRRITSEFYIKNIDLTVYKGEVLALAGKNAAGKSTLTSVINGAMPADSGRIWLDGTEVRIANPAEAVALGIVTLLQNNEGFTEMTVLDNIFMGSGKHGGLSLKKLEGLCVACFARLGIALAPTARFGSLSPAQKQLVAIARAALAEAKLIIMDEPSSHLPPKDCETLASAVRALRDTGVSILYITHRLGEILALCDRVAFIQRGEVASVREVAGMDEMDLIEAIEGFRPESIYGARVGEVGAPLLEVRGLRTGDCICPLNLTLHAGELVAVLGGAASGLQTLCKALYGLVPYKGDVLVRGEPIRLQSPLEADARRMVCAVDGETAETISHYDSHGGQHTGMRYRIMAALKEAGTGFSKMFGTFTGANRLQHGEYMTGGYRQRELVLRALARDGDIYLLVAPSNGVDLQTRMLIYSEMRRAQERGNGIICFTGDAEEALGLADTVLVLRESGQISHEAAKTSLNELKSEVDA